MTSKDVQGNVSVEVSVKAPTKYLIIHAYDFDGVNGEARDSKNNKLKVKREFLYEKNQYHIMELESEIKPGTYHLNYVFTYDLKKNLKGFYESTYENEKGEKK